MFSSSTDPFSYAPNNSSSTTPPPHNIDIGGGGAVAVAVAVSCAGTNPFLQLPLSASSSSTQNLPYMMFEHGYDELMINPSHSSTYSDNTNSFLCHPHPPNNNNNNNFPFLFPTAHPYCYPNNHQLVDGNPAENCNNALIMQQQESNKGSSSSSKNKERHSKIETAGGVRDRRVRLSIATSRKFFDLQDMLGFDKPSKTLDWLLSNSSHAIQRLHANAHSPFLHSNTNTAPAAGNRNNYKAGEDLEAGTIVSRRVKARARARDRTTSRSNHLNVPNLVPAPPHHHHYYYYYQNNNNNNNPSTSTSTCSSFGALQQPPHLSGIAIDVGVSPTTSNSNPQPFSYSMEMMNTSRSTTDDDGPSSLVRLMKWELNPPPQSTDNHQPHNNAHRTTTTTTATSTWDMITTDAPITGMQICWEGEVAHFSNPPPRFH